MSEPSSPSSPRNPAGPPGRPSVPQSQDAGGREGVENGDLRDAIRALAMRREHAERRVFYRLLIDADLWVAVAPSVAGMMPAWTLAQCTPAPKQREKPGGDAPPLAFAGFTHEAAFTRWAKTLPPIEDTQPPVAIQIPAIAWIERAIARQVNHLQINPEARYAGSLLNHELQTLSDGAKKLAEYRAAVAERRAAKAETETETRAEASSTPEPDAPTKGSWFNRLFRNIK